MLLSLNWLRDYLVKNDVKIEPRELAEKLTMRGLAVASIARPSGGLDKVVVGRILRIEKHPNADRLQITKVITSDSPNAQELQIVCGAKNIAEGDTVPVALPGAMLPGDLSIKASAIRGVDSHGMLCSSKELGVADDHEGILQLPKSAVLGQPVSELLGHHGPDDVIFEFELTPNRGDCLSVMGLAREIAPLLDTKVREPKPGRFRNSAHRTSAIIKVEVDDPRCCPRYVARVIDSLKVTESPDWIKARLQSVGVRPINNIVDVTNFVMLEYGQPLHAFDLRRIESGCIRVAPCAESRDFTLLSGQNVRLEPGDILILDGDRPVALAGIMGGLNSQVEGDTTSIVLESAAFLATQIRRTARRLGLHTDSSKRFEKGTDILGVLDASERAAALLRDSHNANVYHPPIDTDEQPRKDATIALDMREVKKLIGLRQISPEGVIEVLEKIGISAHRKSVNILQVRVPTFRPDLLDSIDAIEEVARLVGYEHIPQTLPLSPATYDEWDESTMEFDFRAKQTLCSMGLRETIHYSFTSEENLSRYGLLQEQMIRVKNPISEEMKVMRTSLLPSLLQTYRYNLHRKQFDQRLFEVASIYLADDEQETRAKEVPYAAGVISGHVVPPGWMGKSEPVGFFDGKGIVENLLRQLTTVKVAYEQPRNSRLLHPNRSAVIKLGLREVGFVGEVHPFIRSHVLDTTEPVVVFELCLEALRKFQRTTVRYKVPSKFPSVEVDLAFLLDKAATSLSVAEAISLTGGSLLADVSVFDVYEGANIPSDKKSLGFRLTFLSPERTLQDAEVTTLRDRIVQAVSEKFGAQIRA